MNVKELKKIIKESLREVIKEELGSIGTINESQVNNIGFNSDHVDLLAYRKKLAKNMGFDEYDQPKSNKSTSSGNPYLDILAQTAAEMKPSDFAQMRQNFD